MCAGCWRQLCDYSSAACSHVQKSVDNAMCVLQGVLSMAREADPKGVRTIGVLTKPDQVEEGCHGQWLQVLQGKR